MTSAAHFILGASPDNTPVLQRGRMSNRHGLIAGATGTGKTVTLQILAESFARLGVPVFAADIKGDLSGIAAAGTMNKHIEARLTRIPVPDYQLRGYPTVFWDIFGQQGHPVRATPSEMGPLLLGNLLELNDTQSGVLYALFKISDDQGLLLLDMKDLRGLLNWMGENAASLRNEYGNITTASIGAIQRKLLMLEEQGADLFFGEPALQLNDLMQTDFSGNGVISLLDASQLFTRSPRLYASFLLWLLAELFEQLPETGDADKPRLVLFFDEAHLLFANTPKPVVEKIEQVVRLIRSKGVGVFFISQSPADIPNNILGQLGLRVQHALRAYTPADRKIIKAAADSFRPNPAFNTDEVITELAIGEALVSALDDNGSPTPVERTLIRPPESRIGPLTAEERKERLERSPLKGRYDTTLDRESAHELLAKRAEQAVIDAQQTKTETPKPRRSSNRQGVGEALIKSAARSVGSQLGRQLLRGIMGALRSK